MDRDKLILNAKNIIKKGLTEDYEVKDKSLEFNKINPSEEKRKSYREILFNFTEIDKVIGSVILDDETIKQSVADKKLKFTDVLHKRNINLGFKADKDTNSYQGIEFITNGIDDLENRIKTYDNELFIFSKWKTIITIDCEFPSEHALTTNSNSIVKFATISQKYSIVPIVEIEFVSSELPFESFFNKCENVIKQLFDKLKSNGVLLEGLLLKTNLLCPLILSGKEKPSPEKFSRLVLGTLTNSVPPEVPGNIFTVSFSEKLLLNDFIEFGELIKSNQSLPWSISFSLTKPLHKSLIQTWKNDQKLIANARTVYNVYANKISIALHGF